MRGGVGRRRRRMMLRLMSTKVAPLGGVFVGAVLVTAALVVLFDHDQPHTSVKSFPEALWLTLETLSTVGYGDVAPVSVGGRVVTAIFIVFTLVTLGLLLAALNETVLEVKRMDESGLLGTDMSGHIVVYGFSAVAQTAVAELLGADRRVALVCESPDQVAQARQLGRENSLFVTSGELSQELLRTRLNANAASTAVVAGEDDTRNLVGALNVRAVNPSIRIIVSVRAPELRQTLMASGVTYVASPFELSGRLVASAAFEPEVAKLVEDITSSVDEGYDLQQFSAAPFAGSSVAELRRRLEEIDGPLLLATAVRHDGDYLVRPHPPARDVLAETDHIIVLTNDEQAERLCSRWNLRQGR